MKQNYSNKSFQKSWAPVHLLSSRATGDGDRSWCRRETATRRPRSSWRSGRGTSSHERSVSDCHCVLLWAEINISFQGVAVKKQQSFESYLDSDGNKKQPDIGCHDSYPGCSWGHSELSWESPSQSEIVEGSLNYWTNIAVDITLNKIFTELKKS